MAHPAKTAHDHWLHGTVPQTTKATESVFAGGRPKIPSHLNKVARSEFKRCCKILIDRGTSTEGDFLTLALYAEIYARWIEAKKQLGDNFIVQMTIKDTNGVPKIVDRPSPLLKVCEVCENKLLALAKNLGLTATDRDKVKRTRGTGLGPEALPTNPMDDFLARRPSVVAFQQPLTPPKDMED